MKLLLYGLLLLSLFPGGLNTITKVNKFAKQAGAAYARKDYVQAIATYTYLLHDLEVEDDQLQLNLAHSYYSAGDFEKAQQEYQLIADHPSGHLRAIVHLQLGNIASTQKKYSYALALYKQALITEPANETARYNYELLKKYIDLHPEKMGSDKPENIPDNQEEKDSLTTPPPASDELEPEPAKNKDEQGSEQEETDMPSPDTEGTEGEQKKNMPEKNQAETEREEKSGRNPGDILGKNPDSTPDPEQQQKPAGTDNLTDLDVHGQTKTNRHLHLTPDKAKMLLDAMRNVELQYLQQLPKKSSKKPDPSLPDW